MSDKLKKYVLPNLPYLFIFWLADKLGQAFRLSTGANIGKKLMDAVNGLALLGRDPLPSVTPATCFVDWPGLPQSGWWCTSRKRTRKNGARTLSMEAPVGGRRRI